MTFPDTLLGSCRFFAFEERGKLVNSLIYLLFRLAFRVLIGRGRYQSDSELEILVLRHQLNVLKRQNPNPRITNLDRAFLAAAARSLKKPVTWNIHGYAADASALAQETRRPVSTKTRAIHFCALW